MLGLADALSKITEESSQHLRRLSQSIPQSSIFPLFALCVCPVAVLEDRLSLPTSRPSFGPQWLPPSSSGLPHDAVLEPPQAPLELPRFRNSKTFQGQSPRIANTMLPNHCKYHDGADHLAGVYQLSPPSLVTMPPNVSSENGALI